MRSPGSFPRDFLTCQCAVTSTASRTGLPVQSPLQPLFSVRFALCALHLPNAPLPPPQTARPSVPGTSARARHRWRMAPSDHHVIAASFDAAITARNPRDDCPLPKSPAPMARPVVHLTRASLTAERFLFSHPTHHRCNPCQSRDRVRWTAPGGDESDRINTRSCRKRQRPFRSLAQLIDIPLFCSCSRPFWSLPASCARADEGATGASGVRLERRKA